MTATYDGILSVTREGVGACCRPMDMRIMSGWVRVSTVKGRQVLTLRVSEDPKAHRAQIIACPFCGAPIREASA